MLPARHALTNRPLGDDITVPGNNVLVALENTR
jgi:hypothetical protein